MLAQLFLENFRGFERHELTLRSFNILVGQNNAGKSTITEALRLVSIITSRYGSLSFREPPSWSELSRKQLGVRPSLRGLEFNDLSMFNRLGDPPAKIVATFENRMKIEIFLGRGAEVFASVYKNLDEIITTKSQAQKNPLPKVSILPQIGPLIREEKILGEEYVRSVELTSLASLHFRNQLRLYPDEMREFKELVQASWPDLRIRSLEGKKGLPGDPLALLIQDGDFVAEIGWMGHGLQMWLQTMWFLARSKEAESIILDEPDVYMHADLQRKLIRLVKNRNPQVIVATHSVEIISEVEPSEILIVDRKSEKSVFATSLPAAQEALRQIGSIHNLQLARLWNSRKLILVEGKDLRFLKTIQDKLFPESQEPFDAIPNMQIGGWTGWPYVIGSRMVLKNALGEEVKAYCILDRDYHTKEEIQKRQKQAIDHGICLHIWEKKEIENYFIVPEVIAKIINENLTISVKGPTVDDVKRSILSFVEKVIGQVFDAIANEFLWNYRSGGLPQANRRARELVDKACETEEGKISLVSGKELITYLSHWSQSQFGVSISSSRILKALDKSQLDPEIIRVVRAIEKRYSLN